MITGPQCHAARVLVQLSREKLSRLSGIDPAKIEAYERQIGTPTPATIDALKAALEAAGAVFIAENGGGAGVRLKFSRAEARRIATLEGEGGIAADDDVP